jgi:hypothetical protein
MNELSSQSTNPQFGLCKHNPKWIKGYLKILCNKRFACLNEDVCETVDDLAHFNVSFLVAEEFLALNNSLVLFELVLSVADVTECFEQETFLRFFLAETIKNHNSLL